MRESLGILRSIIDGYMTDTSYKDIVNISKQTEFSKYITKEFLKHVTPVKTLVES